MPLTQQVKVTQIIFINEGASYGGSLFLINLY